MNIDLYTIVTAEPVCDNIPDQLAAQGLSRFIGAAQGNFISPEEVDRFIRQERET